MHLAQSYGPLFSEHINLRKRKFFGSSYNTFAPLRSIICKVWQQGIISIYVSFALEIQYICLR